MNGPKKFLYYFLYPACLIFTILSLGFYAISASSALDDSTKAYAILMIFIFIYAIFISLVNQIFTTKLPAILKTIIHYLIIAFSLFAFFALEKEFFSTKSAFIVIGIFTAIYLAFALPLNIKHAKNQKKENKNKDYKSFKDKK